MSDAAIAYYDDQGRAVFRASAVNKCSKALTAGLLGFDAMSPPPDIQARFNAGHKHEQELLDHVESHGWVLYGGQGEYDVPLGPNIIIRGHIDSLASHREHGIALVEAKTMAPSSYEKWLAKRWQGSDLFRHYADQTSIYWESIKPDVVIMVVGRKATDEDTGETTIDAIDMTSYYEPPANVSRIKARLAKVVNQAKTGMVPEECDSNDFPCPYYPLHTEPAKHEPVWVNEEIREPAAVAMEHYLLATQGMTRLKNEQKAAREDIEKLIGKGKPGASGRFMVEYTPSTRTTWDEDAMRRDGVVIDKYKKTAPTAPRISVKEIGQ